jgi:3D (Asp-Asp-Asp) domain-containing protein
MYTAAMLAAPLTVELSGTTALAVKKHGTAPLAPLGEGRLLKELAQAKQKDVEQTPPPKAEVKPEVKETANLSRGGLPIDTESHVAAVLEGFQVTWYNNDYDKTDITASGAKTIAGRTVSVDPRIIPLGTWIEICLPDGRVLKRKAEDTGGAVHGRILDVYADQPASVLRKRGRTRNVVVKILKGE